MINIYDLVLLYRACSFSERSLVGLIQHIDPSEKEADTVKLTQCIRDSLHKANGLVKTGLDEYTAASRIHEYLVAPFPQVPRPRLITLRAVVSPTMPNISVSTKDSSNYFITCTLPSH